MINPIKWDCVKSSDSYWIRAEKPVGDRRLVEARLIRRAEWEYSSCKRIMLESIIHRMTRNIEEASK